MMRVAAALVVAAMCPPAAAHAGQDEWTIMVCTPGNIPALPTIPEWVMVEIKYNAHGDVVVAGRPYAGQLTAAELSFVDKDGDRWRISRVSGIMKVGEIVGVCRKPKL